MKKIGMRVGAARSTGKDIVYMYGYGTYVGDETDGPLDGVANPKIVLDDGGVVWGCECWWGEEKQFKEQVVGNSKVEFVPLPTEEERDRTRAVMRGIKAKMEEE